VLGGVIDGLVSGIAAWCLLGPSRRPCRGEQREWWSMASHEREAGFLDYGSGRYKLIGRAGREDHYLHAGEWVEVWIGTGWVAVQVQADVWGRWSFLDADGVRVEVQVGMRASLGSSC
jgi:uncharacterized protein DUF5348